MARCEDCLHYAVCCVQGKLVKTDEHNWYELGELGNVQDFCEHFIADVVPKSEVEKIFEELDGITDLVAKGLINEFEFYDMLAELRNKHVVGKK